jgi:hypothetical protein
MLYPARHVSVSIDRPADLVYAYAADPATWPTWAAGLVAGAFRPDGDVWIADSPGGPIRVRFAEPNRFGVLDHHVTLPDGRTTLNPMRVVPNGDGAELTFTVYRLPDATDQSFAADAAQVEADLRRLKALLEEVPAGQR